MQNRRSTIVVDKNFQYQYSLLVVTLTILIVNCFIIIRMLSPIDHALSMTTDMALWVAGIEALLMAGVWYGSLKATHKIAGPIYVFSREIGKLGSGDLTAHINLRPRDSFQAVAADMNASLSALRSRVAGVKVIAEGLRAAQAEDRETGELLASLCEELARLTTEKAS